MGLRIARLANLFLMALALGMAYCHVLEIPGKLRLGSEAWFVVQSTLYGEFGRSGAVVEVAAILLTWIVLFMVRGRRPAFGWTLAAALAATAAIVVWFAVVYPVNAAAVGWTPETLPADWASHRNQWEAGHAVRAALFAFALLALIIAVLAETPARLDRPGGGLGAEAAPNAGRAPLRQR